MIRDMNSEELNKALKELLERLIKSGLMPPLSPEKKNELVTSLEKKITRDATFSLSKADLGRSETLTSLGAALIAENDPSKKFDGMDFIRKNMALSLTDKALLNELFKPQVDQFAKDHPELRKQLENTLDNLAKTLEHDLKPDKQKELKADLEMVKMLKGDKFIEKQLRDQRVMDNGVDTTQTGGMLYVLQSICYGDQFERRNDSSTPANQSFKTQMNVAGSGKTDPLGARFETTVNSLMSGVIANKAELNASQTSDIISLTLGVPVNRMNAPKPPGSNTGAGG